MIDQPRESISADCIFPLIVGAGCSPKRLAGVYLKDTCRECGLVIRFKLHSPSMVIISVAISVYKCATWDQAQESEPSTSWLGNPEASQRKYLHRIAQSGRSLENTEYTMWSSD